MRASPPPCSDEAVEEEEGWSRTSKGDRERMGEGGSNSTFASTALPCTTQITPEAKDRAVMATGGEGVELPLPPPLPEVVVLGGWGGAWITTLAHEVTGSL